MGHSYLRTIADGGTMAEGMRTPWGGAGPVTEPVAGPVAEPVAGPGAEPVTGTVAELVAGSVAEPVA